MHSVDDKTFRKIVADAIDGIPSQYADHIKNLAFVIANDPSPAQRKNLRLGERQTLFGLYEGVPLTSRSGSGNLILPHKITIFKHPLEANATNHSDLVEKVKQTIWHEVAHYYGLGHERISELESK